MIKKLLRAFLGRYYVRGMHRAVFLFGRIGSPRIKAWSNNRVRLNYDLRASNELKSYFRIVDDDSVKRWAKLLEEDETFIDVGANVGFYTAHMGAVLEKGHVLAFEPNPSTRVRLNENIDLNDLENVTVFPFALSNAGGNQVFCVGMEHGLSRLTNQAGDAFGLGGEIRETFEVALARLDDIVDQRSCRRVAGIKLDIEGNELNALRGGLNVLTRDEPILQFEYNPELIAQYGEDPGLIFRFLDSISYVVFVPQTPSSLIWHKSRLRLVPYDKDQHAAIRGIDLWACSRKNADGFLKLMNG